MQVGRFDGRSLRRAGLLDTIELRHADCDGISADVWNAFAYEGKVDMSESKLDGHVMFLERTGILGG